MNISTEKKIPCKSDCSEAFCRGYLCHSFLFFRFLIFLTGFFHRILKLQSISSSDISRIFRIRDQLFGVQYFCEFVHHKIFNNCIFTDGGRGQNQTVFDHSAFFNDAASSDNRVFYGSFNETAVGNHGIFDVCRFEILGRAGNRVEAVLKSIRERLDL